METIIKQEIPNGVRLCIDQGIYSHQAILNTMYLFKHRCQVDICGVNDNVLSLDFIRKKEGEELEVVIRDFITELPDYQLRHYIHQETKDIHKLIVQEAFSPLDEKGK